MLVHPGVPVLPNAAAAAEDVDYAVAAVAEPGAEPAEGLRRTSTFAMGGLRLGATREAVEVEVAL